MAEKSLLGVKKQEEVIIWTMWKQNLSAVKVIYFLNLCDPIKLEISCVSTRHDTFFKCWIKVLFRKQVLSMTGTFNYIMATRKPMKRNYNS